MMIVFVRSPKANEPVEFSLPGILKFYLVRPKLTIAKADQKTLPTGRQTPDWRFFVNFGLNSDYFPTSI